MVPQGWEGVGTTAHTPPHTHTHTLWPPRALPRGAGNACSSGSCLGGDPSMSPSSWDSRDPDPSPGRGTRGTPWVRPPNLKEGRVALCLCSPPPEVALCAHSHIGVNNHDLCTPPPSPIHEHPLARAHESLAYTHTHRGVHAAPGHASYLHPRMHKQP